MRDLLNKLDEVLLVEKARGLLYRDPGDTFFQGTLQSPTAEIVFRDLDYYPSQPGAYDSYEEMAQAGQKLAAQYPNGIIWSNRPGARSRAFAVLTFDGPGKGETTSFGRFFDQIKPDMSGLWKNNELPGNWQLKKATSLKGSYYKLKPSDLFPPESKFDSPADCISGIGSNADASSPGQEQAIQQILPGMQMLLKKQYPIFSNIDPNMISAVRDDLGETIGPIAMVQGMIKDATLDKARIDILGQRGTFAGSQIYFPASKINGLVDSYLLQPGGVEIGVSSKGESGAKASVKNIADGVVRAREKGMTDLLDQYADQVEIIERVGSLGSRDLPLVLGQEYGYITKSQAAAILKLIDSGAKNLNSVNVDSEDRKVLQGLMDEYKPKTDNPKYNVGYHVLAVLAKKVMTDINKDPKFGEACLKFLNTSPIVQLHLKGREGKDSYTVSGFDVKYPPDFRGTVALDASKVYAATGTNGRVSFAYNPTVDAEALVSPADEPGDSPAASSAAAVDQDFETPRSNIKARREPAKPAGDQAVLGRQRRSR
jgi:hypothetical protein